MKISVIVSLYKNLVALNYVLLGFDFQRFKDFEVIVAEDDFSLETLKFIEEHKSKRNFPILHVNQDKDDGFRKCQILNKAILKASGNFVVFIDGDCIPHSDFLLNYSKFAGFKHVYFGRRVMLSPKLTQKIMSNDKLPSFNFFALLFSGSKNLRYLFPLASKKLEEMKGIWGCNWGVSKELLFKVNGFDEEYVRYGIGEDTDIEWRLRALGVSFYSINYQAIVFHLHHKVNQDNAKINENIAIMEQKKKVGKVFCENGIMKSVERV